MQKKTKKQNETQSSVSKHNQRALFLILVGSRPPALETLYVHFHRRGRWQSGGGTGRDKNSSKQTVLVSENTTFSSEAHWIQIMSRGDAILLSLRGVIRERNGKDWWGNYVATRCPLQVSRE